MDQNLKRQIMGRVMAAFYLRRYGTTFINLVIFVGASVATLKSVSVGQVLTNMPSPTNLDASYNFFTSAVVNTELAVKISLLVITAILFSYAVSLVRRGSPKVSRQAI